MPTQTIGDRKVYVPAAFGKIPENAGEALLSAAALLEEEGRWRRAEWYVHDNTDLPEYKDDPYCNGWGACADGALRTVTVGLQPSEPRTARVLQYWKFSEYDVFNESLGDYERAPEGEIYTEARNQLDVTFHNVYPKLLPDLCIVDFNDASGTTREQVIDLMRKAAEAWQQESQEHSSSSTQPPRHASNDEDA